VRLRGRVDRAREADITKEKIQKILRAGANVVLTTKAIDDLCLKYLVEAGVLGVRRVSKEDARRVASATGATLLPNLADLDGNETFDAAYLGEAEEVLEEMVGDNPMVFVRGTKTTRACSIVLRGPNEFALDEMDRYGVGSHDAAVRCTTRSASSSACSRASRSCPAAAASRPDSRSTSTTTPTRSARASSSRSRR
jgi:T-complex protein 1 subunit alpha